MCEGFMRSSCSGMSGEGKKNKRKKNKCTILVLRFRSFTSTYEPTSVKCMWQSLKFSVTSYLRSTVNKYCTKCANNIQYI